MRPNRLTGPRPGLLSRILAGVAGLLAFAGLFLAGLIAWVLLAGAVFVGGIALAITLWRHRRQMARFTRRQRDAYIEVEYEVVSEEGERNE